MFFMHTQASRKVAHPLKEKSSPSLFIALFMASQYASKLSHSVSHVIYC